MVVRVRLRVKAKGSGRSLELPVLVNGGAESPRECLVVDPSTARRLALWPSSGEVYSVEEASSTTQAHLIPRAVELELMDSKGNVLSAVEADLVVQEGLYEPLITDVTIDSLGIQVVSFSKGLWRHVKDSLDTVRRSCNRA